LLLTVLLQTTPGLEEVRGAAAGVTKSVASSPIAALLWWAVLFFATTAIALGVLLWKEVSGRNELVEKASEKRVDGYAKAELELKARHSTEIAVNEANHQNTVRGLQKTLDDSNIERRELSNRLTSMARDMAELFDTFASKINTFAELQASQVARLETVKVEILLEITRLISSR
jgi:hypothetical protein